MIESILMTTSQCFLGRLSRDPSLLAESGSTEAGLGRLENLQNRVAGALLIASPCYQENSQNRVAGPFRRA